MIAEPCKNRLLNWKFEQARAKLTGEETAAEKTTIEALADTFGDPGWFDGNLGVIVDSLVLQMVYSSLWDDEEEDEPDQDK